MWLGANIKYQIQFSQNTPLTFESIINVQYKKHGKYIKENLQDLLDGKTKEWIKIIKLLSRL